MPIQGPLDAIPLWALFLATLFLILICVEAGYRLGKFRARFDREKEAPVGAMVATNLGLLAFLLAFAFDGASDRFNMRKELVLEEANAIGTTYLRAEMLPIDGESIRALLREYVDVRLEAVRSGKIAEGMRKSEELQGELWKHAAALVQSNPNSIIVGLFVQSLNEVIDLHAKRVTVAMTHRIPGVIWGALFVIVTLSLMGMGYHAGLAGTSRSIAKLAVAFTFALVIWLIADLDRPQSGMLRVNQQALIDLQNQMKGSR